MQPQRAPLEMWWGKITAVEWEEPKRVNESRSNTGPRQAPSRSLAAIPSSGSDTHTGGVTSYCVATVPAPRSGVHIPGGRWAERASLNYSTMSKTGRTTSSRGQFQAPGSTVWLTHHKHIHTHNAEVEHIFMQV